MGRAISLVESGGPAGRELVRSLYPETGNARILGITGPPGAGKSTLVDRLGRELRAAGSTVAILAVDPTSPFSGGAILGDRIRMQALYTDPGVFIRSMATRGAVGGLARASHDAVDLMDAAGFDWVLVETVGVGQDEVDIVGSVDTVVVVTVPGLGDDIQAIKAGILEIADLFVINKADREGLERAKRDLRMLLGIAEGGDWRPPILETVATHGEGIDEVVRAANRHRAWLEEEDRLATRRRDHLRQRVETILEQRVLAEAAEATDLEAVVSEAFQDREDPYSLAERLFRALVREESAVSEGAGR